MHVLWGKLSHLKSPHCLCQELFVINTCIDIDVRPNIINGTKTTNLHLKKTRKTKYNIFLYLLSFFKIHFSEIVAKCNMVTETTIIHVLQLTKNENFCPK